MDVSPHVVFELFKLLPPLKDSDAPTITAVLRGGADGWSLTITAAHRMLDGLLVDLATSVITAADFTGVEVSFTMIQRAHAIQGVLMRARRDVVRRLDDPLRIMQRAQLPKVPPRAAHNPGIEPQRTAAGDAGLQPVG